MKILALDSSGLTASVALTEDDNLIAEYTIQYKKTHSQTLLPMLEEIRNMVELDLATVDAIAVAAGPGSFTGLRIGSATAKGLAFAMEKPVIPVPTLEGLAYQMYGSSDLVCPIMDARRSQVYTGIYEFAPGDREKERAQDSVAQSTADEYEYDMCVIKEQCAVSFDEIAESLNHLGRPVVFVGDGIPVFRERMREVLRVPYTLAPAHRNRQSAACIAALGRVYYAQGRIVSGAKHVPEYLRLSQAERERAQAVVTYRRMTPGDVPYISKLEEQTFSMPWSADSFLEMISKEDARYYVAERDGQLLGGCGVLMIAGEGNITNVVIAPEARNQGVGTAMLQHLMREGDREGLTAYTLEVRVSNAAAIHVYEKLGFVSAGIRPNFYEKPAEDALIFWKR